MRSRKYRVKNKRRLSIFIFVMILLVIVLFGLIVQSGRGVGIGFKVTKVSGLSSQLNPAAGSVLTETFKVTPANGRRVFLQSYDKEEEKWVTQEKFNAGSEDTDSVKLTFPDSWQRKTYTSWRVLIPASKGGRSYEKRITVTQMNRGSAGIHCSSAVIMDMKTGAVLYGYNMNKRLPNASTTKMMTAIISFRKADPDTEVKITKNILNTPDGNLYKKKGDIFLLHDLWRAMLIASSNDSAEATAEATSGSEEAFVQEMNDEVSKLGLKNTHFENPHGMDSVNHYSSAYDLAKINIEAFKLKEYRTITMQKSVKFRAINHKRRYNILYTTNDLILDKYKGCLGGKTGTTNNAGQCYSGVYEYHGRKYVTVVMHSNNCFKDVKRLCKYVRTWKDN